MAQCLLRTSAGLSRDPPRSRGGETGGEDGSTRRRTALLLPPNDDDDSPVISSPLSTNSPFTSPLESQKWNLAVAVRLNPSRLGLGNVAPFWPCRPPSRDASNTERDRRRRLSRPGSDTRSRAGGPWAARQSGLVQEGSHAQRPPKQKAAGALS
jgi:hypothetical protein